ncbi:7191_t:CDS:2 [Paraglomus occultum]|uniref:Protein YIP n=1 Tax=Paraglomus occultum TaxID=144539 RepID=A0A9N8VU62_9GLOM|nr:7191_t:CDS:2 [Paraglomus occultum]
MSREQYSVVVENTGRQELEFQDYSSSSGVGGKITSDKQTSSSSASFGNPFYDPQQSSQTETQGTSYPFWSIEYYAQFFDVDTDQVLERAGKSLFPRESFAETVGPRPDLYGPFWISTTVIFLLFVTSSIAGSIAAHISGRVYAYDFKILTFGAIAVYVYAFAVPLVVWIVLKYLGCRPGFLDTIALYGYAMTVWIPVAIFCVVPSESVRWTLVAVGFAISGFFITRNLYPVISQAEAKAARLIIIFIIAAHAALALLMKVEFFSYEIKTSFGDGGNGDGGSDGGDGN